MERAGSMNVQEHLLWVRAQTRCPMGRALWLTAASGVPRIYSSRMTVPLAYKLPKNLKCDFRAVGEIERLGGHQDAAFESSANASWALRLARSAARRGFRGACRR